MAERMCAIEDCQRIHHAAGFCGRHYKRWSRTGHPSPGHVSCAVCAASFTSQHPRARYCSRRCNDRAAGQRKRGPVRQFDCPACGREIVTRDSRTLFCRTLCGRRFYAVTQIRYTECVVCARLFTAYGNGINQNTCSGPCRKQAALEFSRLNWRRNYDAPKGAKAQARTQSARRRARLLNALVEDFTHAEVFERDGYRCQLCNRMTQPDQPVPHPRATTLDHVVPLAKGGAHTKANTQCACFQCNVRKGDRTLHPEQLRLLG